MMSSSVLHECLKTKKLEMSRKEEFVLAKSVWKIVLYWTCEGENTRFFKFNCLGLKESERRDERQDKDEVFEVKLK